MIPGEVTLSLEIRDLEMAKIDEVYREIETQGRALAERNETTIELDEYYESRSAPTDERLRELVAESAEALGLSAQSRTLKSCWASQSPKPNQGTSGKSRCSAATSAA